MSYARRALRLLGGAVVAWAVMFIAYTPATGVIEAMVLPRELVTARDWLMELYGWGLAVPYVILLATPAFFLIAYTPVLWLLRLWLRGPFDHILTGMIAWATPIFLFGLAPSIADAELRRRVVLMMLGFAGVQAVVGALAGALIWVTRDRQSQSSGQPPSGQSRAP